MGSELLGLNHVFADRQHWRLPVKIDVVSLFPEFVKQVLEQGMPRVARETGALTVQCRNPRDHADNRYRSVDDRPYGGGPGMVMQAEPLARCIEAARAAQGQTLVLAMSPQGQPLNQALVEQLAQQPALVLVCGRYEGLDERLLDGCIDLEVSLGDFVLSGGELAAMVLIDAIARLLPGVLGAQDSAQNDSFSQGLLDHPHYSRPEQWRGQAVPDVLLSGDHARIKRWREKQALGQTWLKRPDLLDKLELNVEQTALLQEFIGDRQSKGKQS